MFSLALDSLVDTSQVDCVQEAVFFEARGEPFLGQLMVANVIQNRVSHKRFPRDACSVVHQPHQFTYHFDKKVYESDQKSKMRARIVAYISEISPRLLPENVVYYTANKVKYFEGKKKVLRYKTVANHTFYQELV